MQKLTFILLLAILASCELNNSPSNQVDFYGEYDDDTIYYYETKDFKYYTSGLTEGLQDSSVLAAKVSITTEMHKDPGTILTRKNYTLGDSLNFYIVGELANTDGLPEEFTDKIDPFSFYGQLDVYYSNGDTIILRDTVTFHRINPLTHSRMEGEMVNNKREGKWLEYYDKSHNQLARISTFQNGLRHSSDTVFFRNGKPHIISQWKDGKKHGRVETLSRYTGNVYSHITFDEGFPSSKMYYYDHYNNLTDSLDINSL